jgi:hypothetical protein
MTCWSHEVARECYEAFVMYNFFPLLLLLINIFPSLVLAGGGALSTRE